MFKVFFAWQFHGEVGREQVGGGGGEAADGWGSTRNQYEGPIYGEGEGVSSSLLRMFQFFSISSSFIFQEKIIMQNPQEVFCSHIEQKNFVFIDHSANYSINEKTCT